MKIGLDIGYSSVKVAFGDGRVPEVARLPVGAGPISMCNTTISGEADIGCGQEVTISGQPWVAGVDPSRLSGFVSTMDESYATTDEYRAIFYAALSTAGAETVDALVTGLPVTHFQNASMKDELTKMMVGRHYVREGLVVEVKHATVVPQPAGAFAAHTMDTMSGHSAVKLSSGRTVLVVDPGHFSLDWVIFNGGFALKNSGSTSSAGEALVSSAAKLLSDQHGVCVTPARLQAAVLSSSGPLLVGRHSIDFWPALTEVAGEIVRDNLKAIRGSVRGVNDNMGLDIILLTGGGAALFHDAIENAFKDSTVLTVRDPVTANARGFYTYCTQVVRANQLG